jgi:hypothetical protein
VAAAIFRAASIAATTAEEEELGEEEDLASTIKKESHRQSNRFLMHLICSQIRLETA